MSNRFTTRIEPPRGTHVFGAAVEKKLGLGFLIVVLLSVLVGVVATYAQDGVARSKERVAKIGAGDLVDVEKMFTALEREVAASREYILTGREASLTDMEGARTEFLARIWALEQRGLDAQERVLMAQIERAERAHDAARDELVELRSSGGAPDEILEALDTEVTPKLEELRAAITTLERLAIERLETARQESNDASVEAARFVRMAVIIDVLLAGGLGLLFLRTFGQLRRAHQERLALWAREREARAHAEETKQAQAELVKKLEQSNEDLEAFTGRIAHDLRNVLSPLALCPARLRVARSEEAVGAVASSVERSIARASSMIDGLLAFSRSAQTVDLTKWAPLSDTVATVADDLAAMAADVQAVVEIEVENVDVACSPELLHLIIMNLLHNALKFLQGREHRQISIRAHSIGSEVEIAINDTGPGIPREAQAKIFEPFYRAPGVKTQGTGIGLSTVQRIVTAYRGEITVQSEPGRGTTFRVRLPRRRSQGPKVEPLPHHPPGGIEARK